VRRALIGQLEGEPDEADYQRPPPIFLDSDAENTYKRSLLYPGVREGLDYFKGRRLQTRLRDQQGGTVHAAAVARSGCGR